MNTNYKELKLVEDIPIITQIEDFVYDIVSIQLNSIRDYTVYVNSDTYNLVVNKLNKYSGTCLLKQETKSNLAHLKYRMSNNITLTFIEFPYIDNVVFSW